MSLWGTYPLWFQYLTHVPAFELLLHRIVWSCVFIVPLTIWGFNKKQEALTILRSKESLKYVLLSTSVLGVWWFSYTYAVISGRVLDASLGYFIGPIMTVLFGKIIFHEKASTLTNISVLIVFCGVLYYCLSRGTVPVLAIVLGLSYSCYTVLRKLNSVADSQAATMIENLILLPFSLISFAVLFSETNLVSYIQTDSIDAFLFFMLGVINVLPIWWYGISAKYMPLLAISFFQYIPPTCNFLLAIFLFGEVLDIHKLIMFGLVWAGIGIYLLQLVISNKSLNERS